MFVLLGASSVAADAAENGFSQQVTPSHGAARAIGEYSAGCLSGAKPLALDAPGYHVMHPSRLRYFGHPALLDFIRTLGRAAHAQKLSSVLIGDMSQPRGGRALGGHASHQTGLDVDIWYWTPKHGSHDALATDERENLKARSVLNGKSIAPAFALRVTALLQVTASDPRVTRVFVHPIIKRELCASVTGERAWLSKIRPWYGHDDHFHVRLACPSDSPDCTPQAPVPEGDGCGDALAFWFSDAAQADRKQGEHEYEAKVARAPQLPAACAKLLTE